jgi:hypothetical protein
MHLPRTTFALVLGVVLLFAVAAPTAKANPILVTVSFTGNGSVAGTGFTNQNVTVTVTADTASISFPFGANNPTYDPPTTLTIGVTGFGTGAVTNLSAMDIGNGESVSLGFFHMDVNGLTYMDLGNTAFNAWNLKTSIGPVDLFGNSNQGLVQLNNGDVWGTTGIGTSIGNVEITFADNVTVTAVVTSAVPEPGSLALLMGGLGGLALLRLRRFGRN